MSNVTMKAVVFKGPKLVEVEERPIPRIQDPGDIIVEVSYSALCGSELHVFRGHQPSPTGFIMGHEFTGTVHEVGTEVRSVSVGHKIVSPFTISWSERLLRPGFECEELKIFSGRCFYCINGFSSRCEKSKLFGSAVLDGAQAQYVRVPLADATVVKAPEDIDARMLVLMADIFPTGYFAAQNAFQASTKEQIADSTAVVIGCGPVGLCTVIAASTYKPKYLFAIDSIPSRLDLAQSLGAEAWNFQTDREGLDQRIKDVTGGRGADVIMEVVGLSPALRLGFELVRPWGVISSVGVHNGEIPWTGTEAYGKNVRLQMGRCPVRSIFDSALAMLAANQHLMGFMADTIMPLSQAVEGYQLFDDMKAQKVIFEAQK